MQRLFVQTSLSENGELELHKDHAHYLLSVLRMRTGDELLVFNGKDGEWLGRVYVSGKRSCLLMLKEKTRPQSEPDNLHYLFAPLKQARLDYMVQKAVELGASKLQPVLTAHTQVRKVNLHRMQMNAIEAAEQCGGLSIPDICEPITLTDLIANWQKEDGIRQLICCDENAAPEDQKNQLEAISQGPVACLIGPEGGFSENEQKQIMMMPNSFHLSLGQRILRADTAAVAALALIQSRRS